MKYKMEIKLRKWNEADLNSLVKYANNSNIAKWLTNGFPHPYTQKDGEAFLSMIANDNPTKVFAIEANGEAVGSIGIFPQSDIHEKSAEMGYWLEKSIIQEWRVYGRTDIYKTFCIKHFV